MTESRPNPDWRPLALTLACLTAAYAVLYRFMPLDVKAYALWPFGAWALYSGARLSARVALPLTIGVFALTDVVQYVVHNYPPNYVFYLCLAVTVLLGRGLLARSQAPWRIVVGAVGGYAFFFLVSNFAAWLGPARAYYKPHTFETLLQAYVEALEFLRMQPGQLDFGLILSFGLFGAHAYLAKAYFPAERVVVPEHAG
jgi:Family of unknown function (DUF6580)